MVLGKLFIFYWWLKKCDTFTSASKAFHWVWNNPGGIYLFKVNNRNTRKMWEIYSKLTIKKTERRHWLFFIINFEQVFCTLFCCFYCWLWTSKHRLGSCWLQTKFVTYWYKFLKFGFSLFQLLQKKLASFVKL